MSNYSFSNTLDGLNNIEANDVNTDNIVTDYLTVNINSAVPLVTPSTTSSNQIASCAFVQNALTANLSNYVTLNTVQTITANKTFTGTITRNNTTFDYSDYRFYSVLGGGEATQMYQTGGGLTLTSITNNKIITINTKDISGNAVNNLVCGFGNQAYLQGALNNRIDITGTQATIGGTSVPIITTQPLTASNNNEIASTAFVKNQGYAILNANNTFTGINTFTTQAVRFNAGFVQNDIGGGSNSTSMYQSGGVCVITNNYNNGSIRLSTKNNSGVSQDGVYALGGARAGLQGDSGNTIEIFGTQATIGGTSVPKITTQPLTSSNTNEIASTAYVKTNLLDYVTLNTAQTITANKIFNGTTTLNNLFVNNYVDLTLTTYENQFYGDIYGYRGVVCQDGFYVKDGPGAGANTYALIDTSGNISTTTTIAATGNISSSSEISCTGALSSDTGLNIPSTSPVLTIDSGGIITQTSTGINNLFNTTFTSTDNQIRIKAFANTAPSTISQAGSTLQISAITNNTGATLTTITLATRNSTNNGVVILTGNSNNITIGSGTSNTNISSTNIVCNGITSFTNTTTPTITQAILLTDNSTKIATTAFVKGQGYATTSSLSSYALLTPSANPQVFTGQQKFRALGSDLPISIGSTTAGIVGGGGLYVATAAGQYNPIVKTNDCVLLGVGGAIDSANTKLTLTTYASSPVGIQMDIGNMTFDGGIIRQNSPFNCGYSYLGTPVTVKGFFDIGYVWSIPYAAFTGGAWTGTAAIYNILTLAWDGTGNKRLGVWQVDIVIMSNCTGAPLFSLSWNTINATTMPITSYCVVVNNAGAFSSGGVQIARLSFVLNVVNLTTTYYLNSYLTAGAGLSVNTTSNITFTRIA